MECFGTNNDPINNLIIFIPIGFNSYIYSQHTKFPVLFWAFFIELKRKTSVLYGMSYQ